MFSRKLGSFHKCKKSLLYSLTNMPSAAVAASAYTSSYTKRDAPTINASDLPDDSEALSSGTPLEQVRNLRRPTYEELLRRDPYADIFWHRYSGLLGKAWEEWEQTETANGSLPELTDDSVLHSDVIQAFAKAWDDPSNPSIEDEVKKLWEEIAPGVFKIKFFDPAKTHVLREYLDKAAESGIPCRPPYGITLNRKGFMLDERSEGHLASPGFQKFYRELIDKYMRPSGRLLYPEYINASDDSDSFAFTIQYQPSKDEQIRQHSDASALTFNINMNLPDEDYTGSSLYFVDPKTGNQKYASFGFGEAIVHRGAIPHAALPIKSGTRSNVVLWLYGESGRFNYGFPYGPNEQLTREQRWSKPSEKSTDTWAPF